MTNSPKIHICSPSFSKNQILVEELRQVCANLEINDTGKHFSGQALVTYLQDAEVAVIGTEAFDQSIIRELPNLKFVAKYGVGTDNVDIKFLKERGIGFGWQGGVNRRSVSEMALCFLIGLFRNLFFTSFRLKSGEWDKQGGQQLSSRTIGIIGCGYVGSDLISLLRPFNCKILINDIVDKSDFVKNQQAMGVDIKCVELNELIYLSNAISLHVPLTEATANMVNQSFLLKMKPDSFLINTSRGGVVDQKALKSALQNNSIVGAAIDVFDEEPPSDLEFLQLPNLMLTPHIGGNAHEAVLSMGRSSIEGIRDYMESLSCNEQNR